MSSRDYDAILIDLDGTLLNEESAIHPRTIAACRASEASGVRVMIATGRSTISTRPVVLELGMKTPAVVFNGAGLWDPRSDKMLEERVLGPKTLARAIEFGRTRELLTVLMASQAKYANTPVTPLQVDALRGLQGLQIVPRDELRGDHIVRVTFYSETHADSIALSDDVRAAIDAPIYITHFPLSWLPMHRESRASCLDLHPPCRGKAEGVRILGERYGIPPERIVAVGDATNDIPMFEAAGLAVAMQGSMVEALAAADRVIGSNNSTALAELIEELFLGGVAAEPTSRAS
ncbi:MAG: HAD family hydrolase [Planctomycetota bacterium]|nr:HAD family hydrolase [Planctomycetota bacterium]